MANSITYTESFTADGSLYAVTVAHTISFAPLVLLDGVSQTVSVNGIDPPGGSAWYWTPGGSTVTQGTATPPAAGVIITVIYEFEFSNAVSVNAQAAITAQSAFGRSGLIQRVFDVRGITDTAQAQAAASGALRAASVAPVTVKFTTRSSGWQPNQVMSIVRTKQGLNANFMVTAVSSQSQGAPIDGGNSSSFVRTIELMLVQPSLVQQPAAADSTIPATYYPGPATTQTERLIQSAVTPAPEPQYDPYQYIFGADGGAITGGAMSANRPTLHFSGTALFAEWSWTDAPVGQKAVLDILINGASIFETGHKPEIAAGADPLIPLSQSRFKTYPLPYRALQSQLTYATLTYIVASDTPTAARGVGIKLIMQR